MTTLRAPPSCARSELGSGRLRRTGTVTDSLPITGEPEFEHGARHIASFHGASYSAQKLEDGLRIVRGGDATNKGTPIAFFEGAEKWRAEPDEQGRALHVFEIDTGYTGLDRRPRTIVHGSPRDTRDSAQRQMRDIQKRNEAFWAAENAKLAERTNR